MELLEFKCKGTAGWTKDTQKDDFRRYIACQSELQQQRPTYLRVLSTDWLSGAELCYEVPTAHENVLVDAKMGVVVHGYMIGASIYTTPRALDAYRDLEAKLAERPRIAARDTLLLLDDWINAGRLTQIDEFLSYLPGLSLGFNVGRSFPIDVIVASLMSTRLVKDRLTQRDQLIEKTLRRIKRRLGSGAVKATLLRLS